MSFSLTNTSAVGGTPTSIDVAASAATLTVGQAETFTATVTAPAGDSTPSGGTVTFLNAGLEIGTATLVNGQATFTTTSLAAGSYNITAFYGGTAVFAASRSGVEPTSTVSTVGSGLSDPARTAVDGSGDIFIADSGNNRVVEIQPNGTQTTIGSGLEQPLGVTVDRFGDVFIADTANNRVVEVQPNGTQTTIGSGLDAPYDVAVNSLGDIFIADFGNNRVVEVQPNGTQTTVVSGLSGPAGIALDTSGDLFIANFGNSQLLEVEANGTQTTVGSGLGAPAGVAVDGFGDVFIADYGNSQALELKANGTQASLASGLLNPTGIGLDSLGDVFIADYGNNRVVKVTAGVPVTVQPGSNLTPTSISVAASATTLSSGQTDTFTATVTAGASTPTGGTVTFLDNGTSIGTANLVNGQTTFTTSTLSIGSHNITASYSGTAQYAPSFSEVEPTSAVFNVGPGFSSPDSTAVDGSGDLFIAEFNTDQVVEFKANGMETTVASGLDQPYGVAVDSLGDVFIANTGNNQVLEFEANGTQTTVGTGLDEPFGVAVDSLGDVFIADTGNNRVVEVQPDGNQITVASGINFPNAIAVDSLGDVFIAQYDNNQVVEVTAGGTQTTIGSAIVGPTGVAVDGNGNVFIAELNNTQAVEVTANGSQTTIGSGLNQPEGIAVDGAGDVFIDDTGNNRVEEVEAGVLVTVESTTVTTYTSINASTNPTTYGQSVTFTATVSDTSGGVPTGSVEFFDGTTDLGAGSPLSGSGTTATSTFTIATLTAGTHSISAVYTATGGFAGSTGTWSQTVNQAVLTVSGITAANKVYNASTTATLNTSGATLVGVIGGDTVTLNTSAASGTFASKNVGTGITVTVAGLMIGGAQASDYTLIQPTTTANITPAPLTITALTNTKVYDGTTSAAAIPTVNGLVASDSVTNLSETYDTPAVGTGKTLSVASYLVNDGNNGKNYTVTLVANHTGVITASTTTAVFIKTDTATEGNWIGVYGTDGYDVINNPSTSHPNSLPAGVTITPAGATSYTWANPSTATPALEVPGGASRIAAGWYASTSFTVDVDVTNGQSYNLELYVLDYNGGNARSEQIQLSNASTGTVLSTETVSSFSNGAYLNWTISGNVLITITKTAGANAVLSGLFFDPATTSKSTPTITWANPANIVYGTALNSTQLDATASVPGTFTYTPALGTVLKAGNGQTLSVTFTPTDTTDYTTATATAVINVQQATPTITWANPAAITAGTALSGTQLDATSSWTVGGVNGSVAGTFTYTPAAGTVLAVGNNQTLSVSFTPTDTTDYTSATATVTINVTAAVTTSATFLKQDTATEGNWIGVYGTDGYDVVNNPSTSHPNSLPAGVTITPTGVTAYTWANPSTATPALEVPGGTSRIAAAWYASTSFTVDVNVTNGQSYNLELYVLDYNGGNARSEQIQLSNAGTGAVLSTETVSSFSSGAYLNWTISGNVLITITKTAGANAVLSGLFFDPATTSKSTPTITWANPANIVYGTALNSTQLDATASVPGTFTYTPALGTVLKAGNGQTLSVTFTPTDTTDYTTATATAVINVQQATPTITWANPAAITAGTALSGTQLDATSSWTVGGVNGSVAGTFTYTPAAGTVLAVGNNQTLSVSFTPTDTTDYTSATATVTINVTAAVTTSATFLKQDTATEGNWIGVYGTDGYDVVNNPSTSHPNSLPAGVTITPAGATAYTWANPSTATPALEVPGGTSRIAAAWYASTSFTVDVDVTNGQSYNLELYVLDYNGGNARSEQIQLSNAGTGAVLSTETVSSFSNGAYLNWTISGNVLITITKTAGANAVLSGLFFDPAPTSKSTPTITWANPANIVYGTALNSTQLDATASVPGTFTYTPALGTVLKAGNGQTLSVTFTPTDTTDYSTATATAVINVQQATPTITWANPAAITAGTALSGTQLDASSSWTVGGVNGSVAGTFTYTPAAGTVLAVGNNQTLSVSFTPTDTTDYTSATATVTINVTAAVTTSATFLKQDTATEGNWIGVYGTDGYDVVNNPSTSHPNSLPAGVTITPTGVTAYTWANPSTATPALEVPGGTSRIAAAWYASTSFTVDVNVTNGQSYNLELYVLDYNGGNARGEQIQLSNAGTGAVLSTETVSSFSNGAYLNWTISGNVLITITRTAGANAVLSGLFFDPDPPASPAIATASAGALNIGSQGIGIGTDNNASNDEMGTVDFNSTNDTALPLPAADTSTSARELVHDVALEQVWGGSPRTRFGTGQQ